MSEPTDKECRCSCWREGHAFAVASRDAEVAELRAENERLKALVDEAQKAAVTLSLKLGSAEREMAELRGTDAHSAPATILATNAVPASIEAVEKAPPRTVRRCARCGDRLSPYQTRCDDEDATGATAHFICGGDPIEVEETVEKGEGSDG